MTLNTVVAVMGAVGGLGLLWYVRNLHREILQIKRELYYHQQSLKKIPHDIQGCVDPLKIQVAALAEGKAVSPTLIRSGRLYLERSAEEMAQLLANPLLRPHTVLVDVRSAEEFAKRRIPGALLLPVEQLDVRFSVEVPSSAQHIVVYCEDGNRSRLACEFLSRQGLTTVSILKGGLAGWPGPFEGENGNGLIQIVSKPRTSAHSFLS